MQHITRLSGRQKISYLYNSVNSEFINESNNLARDNEFCEK